MRQVAALAERIHIPGPRVDARARGVGGQALERPSGQRRDEAIRRQDGRERALPTVEPGMVAGLVGPNGCGKTTTLGMIAGLITPDEGRISVSGYDTVVSALDARRSLGFVPDTPSGFEHLSVREYLELYRNLYRQPPDRYEERAGVMLEAFGLLEYGEASLGELSHGIRRKVATTAALSLDVPAILIDEPTVGLDPEGVVVLRRLVRHIGLPVPRFARDPGSHLRRARVRPAVSPLRGWARCGRKP